MVGFLEWLGSTPWSIALLESYYMWPLLESTHTLSIAFFVGITIIHDLRLLGWAMKDMPTSAVLERLLPWMKVGFAVMVVSGLLIFYSSPLRYYTNIFFRVKLLLLIAAGINAFAFRRRIQQRIGDWDADASPPFEARLAGGLSLAFWALVVVSGRLIAYNWFECGIQPYAFINWAAGCVVGTN